MKKLNLIKLICCAVTLLCFPLLFSEGNGKQNKVTIEFTNVKPSNGKLLLAVYNSAKNYDKKTACGEASISPVEGTTVYEMELPDGEYLFALCYDMNNNGEMDTGFLGIPKEPYGMSNYDGTGIPGKFEKHKVLINRDTKISIPVVKFKKEK